MTHAPLADTSSPSPASTMPGAALSAASMRQASAFPWERATPRMIDLRDMRFY